ncbi:MAG: citrate/2-methylcitrate synthase [Clostridia bacterium]|nr:citrate/2-methylcitrate synthase [Clostridia bacterium]
MNQYSEITETIKRLAKRCERNDKFDQALYEKYDVKRGLRDQNGAGVVAGLTDISIVNGKRWEDDHWVSIPGELYYRGVDVRDLVKNYAGDHRGFEEAAYLLLFNKLPGRAELDEFCDTLAEYRTLPTNFVRDVILKAPNGDIMNSLSRSVLTLYSYDTNASDMSIENILRQCIQMIAVFPLLAVYAYQAHTHYNEGNSLIIHPPKKAFSTAENVLHMLRPDGNFTELEARVLDIAFILHAEHGGGNNSTFTTRVVTSSGTDTYSAVTAALCSLKGAKHGGANQKVIEMFGDIKAHVSDWSDERALTDYIDALLDGRAGDRSGLIYGVGHAVYSVSDPRAEIFKGFVCKLSVEKGFEEEFALYERVEKIALDLIAKKRKIYKGVCVNVDFYSGLAYKMLNLPSELYTPIFAVSRIAGWSAHRIEELLNSSRIIRPAYVSVSHPVGYVKIDER